MITYMVRTIKRAFLITLLVAISGGSMAIGWNARGIYEDSGIGNLMELAQ